MCKYRPPRSLADVGKPLAGSLAIDRWSLVIGHWSFVISGLLAAACCGCGGKYHTLPVGGKVVLADGRPAAGMQVTFECKQPAVSAAAVTDEQGNFRLGTLSEADGAPAGTYRVAIVEPGGDDPDRPPVHRIHAKYGDPETSGLEFTVDPQHTHFEIKLLPAAKR